MAHRRLKVEDTEWDVWDVRPETRTHRLGNELDNGWLCFQSGSTRRRLHPIPTEWDRSSDTYLVELFSQATEVAPAKKVPGRIETEDDARADGSRLDERASAD
jgi:hypothetical protein